MNAMQRLRLLDAAEDYDSVVDAMQAELSDAWEEYEAQPSPTTWYAVKEAESKLERLESR